MKTIEDFDEKTWSRVVTAKEMLLDVLRPTSWLIQRLELAPGRPVGIWGPPGAGKTLIVQAIGLAIATGRQPFGWSGEAAQGGVTHISFDMGQRALALRYRQLINGLNYPIGADDLDSELDYHVHPEWNLSGPDAYERLSRLAYGNKFLSLDNLRAATPGLDENDSRFAEVVDVMGRACQAADCTGAYLHHTPKHQKRVTLDSGRGTSAILASSGAIIAVEMVEGDPNRRRIKFLRPHDESYESPPEFYLDRIIRPSQGPYDTAGWPDITLVERGQEEATDSSERGCAQCGASIKRLGPKARFCDNNNKCKNAFNNARLRVKR